MSILLASDASHRVVFGVQPSSNARVLGIVPRVTVVLPLVHNVLLELSRVAVLHLLLALLVHAHVRILVNLLLLNLLLLICALSIRDQLIAPDDRPDTLILGPFGTDGQTVALFLLPLHLTVEFLSLLEDAH